MTSTISAPISFTVQAASSGNSNWYGLIQTGYWGSICTTGATQIQSVLPSPVPLDSALQTGGPNQLTGAWNGGCVDQSTKELILCAGGGDADYCGNETYALDLTQPAATLKWRRIGDPSPNASISGTGSLNQDYYSDFGAKSNHNMYETAVYNGKVWRLGSSSCWARKTGTYLWSWDKAKGLAGGTGGRIDGIQDAVKPWVRYGSLVSTGLDFSACALDEQRGVMWKASQYYVDHVEAMDLNTLPSTAATYNFAATDNVEADRASVVASDLSAWFICLNTPGSGAAPDGLFRLAIVDVVNRTKLGVVTCSWPGAPEAGYGYFGSLMYHNGALYYAQPSRWGGTIGKLIVPTTGSGAAKRPNLAGTWTWTTLPNNGTPPPTTPPSGSSATIGTYSKCNLIRDMGDGSAAIVTVDYINAPTYVYRL